MVFLHKTTEESGIIIISLLGELVDKQQAKDLIADVETFLQAEKNKFAFDMCGLKYLNSSGLGVIITILTKARKSGGEVVLFDLSSKVKDLLLITKLNTVFTIVSNKTEAINAFK